MISIDTFRQIALSFPETIEFPHFEKASFRINNKIFATLDIKNKQACIKLSPADQDIFSVFDKSAIFPAQKNWGKHGWTYINLLTVRKDMCMDAMKAAYCEVAPKRLSALLMPTN